MSEKSKTNFRVIHLTFFILLSMSLSLQGQSKLKPTDFRIQQLSNDEIFMKIFVGDFSSIPFRNDDLTNSFVFLTYLNTYSRACRDHLPPDKIQLSEEVCVSEQVTRNGFGHIVNRTCIETETRPTDTYVAPRMHQAMLQLETRAGVKVLQDISEGMRGNANDGVGYLMETIDRANFTMTIQQDMTDLFQSHYCTSPQLEHFQENLRLYALEQSPVRIEYNESLFAGPAPPSASIEQDYEKLVHDLVYRESLMWSMNRYVNGSISDLSISSTDQNGYPTRIKAYYNFYSFGNNPHRGSVIVTFAAGIPECMYFFDFPERCRKPDEQILSAYSNGNYNKDLTQKKNQQNNAFQKDKDFQVFEDVDQMPELIGGLVGLQSNVRYPEAARSKGIQGRVLVEFIVDENGNVLNPKVTRGIGDNGTNDEALRVLKLAKFKPGLKNGKEVAVKLTLPIFFRL